MSMDKDAYVEAKERMLSQRRRVILNNDGGDASKPTEQELSDPLDFLDIRTTPLCGTHVDTISYCTSRGFGMFTHDSKVGQTVSVASDGKNATIAALIARGTDPLKAMVQYGHEHDMEVFWSMRMNDTHDGGARNAEWFAANGFKNENPECLMGGPAKRKHFRKWSAVDYGHDHVRTTAVAFIEEICAGYDIDGIELDFFRHPVLFLPTAEGRPVDDGARQKMTGLMRDVAEVVEREGRRRGRPILVAARTPDDVDYARTIGLDIEEWMRQGLIDIYIPSAYIRLNSWRESVSLGHSHGVQVYAGLSESRVGGGHHADALRSSDESYRARALNAWQAGADGIYLFNLFDPHRRIWGEIGDPETLRSLDKLYFASVRGVGKVAGGAYPHQHFIRIPTLNPGAPLLLNPGERHAVRIEMAEDPSRAGTRQPAMELCLRYGPHAPVGVVVGVAFNGRQPTEGRPDGMWRVYALGPGDARAGWNTVEIVPESDCGGLRLEDGLVRVDHSGELLSDTGYLQGTRKNM